MSERDEIGEAFEAWAFEPGRNRPATIREAFDAGAKSGESRGYRAGLARAVEIKVEPPSGTTDDIVWHDGFTSGVWMQRSAIAAISPAPHTEEQSAPAPEVSHDAE
jgi:hypothetical protein